MSFGNILGQLMNGGLGGQTQNRVTNSANNLGGAGAGGGSTASWPSCRVRLAGQAARRAAVAAHSAASPTRRATS